MSDLDKIQSAVKQLRDIVKGDTNIAPDKEEAAALLAALPAELTVVSNLPTKPGWYTLPSDSQSDMEEWHTNGQEIHYLNTSGNWIDVGWGPPDLQEERPFSPLVPKITQKDIDAELLRARRMGYTAEHDRKRGLFHLIVHAVEYTQRGEYVKALGLITAMDELRRHQP
jgi:hypothetical protein